MLYTIFILHHTQIRIGKTQDLFYALSSKNGPLIYNPIISILLHVEVKPALSNKLKN